VLLTTVVVGTKKAEPSDNPVFGFNVLSLAQHGTSRRLGAKAHLSAAPQLLGTIFEVAAPYGSGGYYAASVAIADVNGDGKPDLFLAAVAQNIKRLVRFLSQPTTPLLPATT
jgi:hypothetical protein